MNYNELENIFLLHELGMFYQRTGQSPSDKYKNQSQSELGCTHSKWSATLAGELGLSEQVQDVILYHHKPETLNDENAVVANILNETNEYFSGKGDELGCSSLASVFSGIKINKNNKPTKHFLPLQKLDVDNFQFPVERDNNNNEEAYKKLWADFKEDLTKIGEDRLSGHLFYLIKKYTTFMPSLSQDISLFDHIKSTTAIATCLHKCMENGPQQIPEDDKFFLLISGGISGIQRFIYRVASPQEAQEGMAKRLRGRSFYLNLLNDAVVTLMLDKLELPEANLIWCGGGNFLILAPNTGQTSQKLEELRKEINQLLLSKFNSELFLNMTWKETRPDELNDFGKMKENIAVELSETKKQKFVDILDDLFIEDSENPVKTCSVCANTLTSDKKLCVDCDNHEKLGKTLAYASYYLRAITAEKELTKIDPEKFDVFLFGVGYKFITDKDNIAKDIRDIAQDSIKIQVFKINNTEFLDEDLIKQCSNLNPPVSFGFSFIANTVPKYENKVLSFTHMAELSKGANKTGILKMDVDNLGKIFATGFVNEKANIARISTMSSMFDFYFSGLLNKICEKYYFIDGRQICDECKEVARKIELPPLDKTTELPEILEPVYRFDGKEQPCDECSKNKIPAVYINYAGGDDLLIIGPWDSIVELASDIRENFKKFTCQNTDINISGGVSIINNKFPIGRAALLAGDLLEKSKDQGRNRMSVFGETVCWDTKYSIKGFHELLKFSFVLENHVAERSVSKGFIYSLMRMWQSNFGYGEGPIDKIRLERKAHIPLLKYKLARTVNKEIRGKFDKQIQQVFPWIKIPVSWVSLRTR